MDLETLQIALDGAYKMVMSVTEDYYRAKYELRRAERELEENLLLVTFEGKIDGKNQQIRDAQARALLNKEFEEVEHRKQLQEFAFLHFKIAELKLQLMRDQLRIQELISAKNGEKD